MQYLTTSYDEEDLKQLLKKHAVHTIISVLSGFSQDVYDAQIRLIRAAGKSGYVKRFVPSEFAIDYSADDEYVYPLRLPVRREMLRSRLNSTG